MSLTRLFLAATFGLCCAPGAAARQTACDLKIEKAPELRGFRLGMTMEQVKAKFPTLDVLNQEFGFVHSRLGPAQLKAADESAYKGVEGIFLGFLDGRLASLAVDYDRQTPWRDVNQFSARVTEGLGLPDAWRPAQGDGRMMVCDGFSLSVRPNHIQMGVPTIEQTIRQRREEVNEKLRQAFRP